MLFGNQFNATSIELCEKGLLFRFNKMLVLNVERQGNIGKTIFLTQRVKNIFIW